MKYLNGQTTKNISSVDEASIKLFGAILRGIDVYPFWAMDRCAALYADVCGLDIKALYDIAKVDTAWEDIPYRSHTHSEWKKLDKKISNKHKPKEFILGQIKERLN